MYMLISYENGRWGHIASVLFNYPLAKLYQIFKSLYLLHLLFSPVLAVVYKCGSHGFREGWSAVFYISGTHTPETRKPSPDRSREGVSIYLVAHVSISTIPTASVQQQIPR